MAVEELRVAGYRSARVDAAAGRADRRGRPDRPGRRRAPKGLVWEKTSPSRFPRDTATHLRRAGRMRRTLAPRECGVGGGRGPRERSSSRTGRAVGPWPGHRFLERSIHRIRRQPSLPSSKWLNDNIPTSVPPFHFDFFEPLPIRIEVADAPLTPDAGLSALRQLDERTGSKTRFATALGDPRVRLRQPRWRRGPERSRHPEHRAGLRTHRRPRWQCVSPGRRCARRSSRPESPRRASRGATRARSWRAAERR